MNNNIIKENNKPLYVHNYIYYKRIKMRTGEVQKKDRLSRVAFDLFYNFLIFEEIVSMLHCYSVKLYSKRRNQKLEVGLNENSKN